MAEQTKTTKDKGNISFSPKVLMSRFRTIKNNPRAYAEFMLKTLKILFFVIGAVIFYQFVNVFIGFNTRNGPYTMIARLFTLLVMVWVFYSMYSKSYKPLKARVMQYANANYAPKQLAPGVKPKSTDEIIDSTLKYFEENNSQGGKK